MPTALHMMLSLLHAGGSGPVPRPCHSVSADPTPVRGWRAQPGAAIGLRRGLYGPRIPTICTHRGHQNGDSRGTGRSPWTVCDVPLGRLLKHTRIPARSRCAQRKIPPWPPDASCSADERGDPFPFAPLWVRVTGFVVRDTTT